MKEQIVILGTMDTKSEEFGFVKNHIEQNGLNTLVIDVGVIDPPGLKPDVTRYEVAKAAGKDLDKLIKDGPSRETVAPVMAEGVKKILAGFLSEDKIHGIISLGGTQGTALATEVMKSLPIGFPKVMVSTVAAGDTSNLVGFKDITMINPRENQIDGVFDLVTIEVMQEMFDGLLFKKSDRMTVAAEMGVPQIICPGGIDNIFGPRGIIMKHFAGRPLIHHSTIYSNTRATAEELAKFAKEQAKRVNNAKGPIEWFIPMKGFCSYTVEGEKFYDPEADKVYVDTLKKELRKDIPVHVLDKDINDPEFAGKAAERLLEIMKK